MDKQKIDVAAIRDEYTRDSLSEHNLPGNPLEQFDTWFREALNAKVWEPNAMVLSTVSPQGYPSSRVVLVKGYSEAGLVFFTNFESRKGQELFANPHASLLFFWPELQRQIRIEGRVSGVAASESDAYFASRPRASQIGAFVSPQSQVIRSREELDAALQAAELQFDGAEGLIPRPEHWGGFCLTPFRFEFWQGRASRLHDRLVYTLQSEGEENPEIETLEKWQISRLAP